jgi:tryptophan-rich hypothetical protein
MNYRPRQNKKALPDGGTADPHSTTPMRSPLARKRRLNPEKLLLSKWTAVRVRNKERHFLVIKYIEPEDPQSPLEFVEMEAVLTRRSFTLAWRDLLDPEVWTQGWK